MPEDVPTTFFGHLDELTRRLKVVLVTLVVSTVAIMVIPGNLNFLQNPQDYEPWVSIFLRSIRERILPPDVKIIALQIADPIELYVLASFMFSLMVTLPVFAYEVYRFVDPALHPHERRGIYPFIVSVSLLFVAGALFGFYVLFPWFIWSMFPFFTAVGAELIVTLMDFYSILFLTIVVTGLIFTFPAFFVLLVKYGIIRTDMFSQKRKYIYLGLVVLAMFISPGASPQGNLLLFVPMAVLLEVSLFIGKRYEKKEKTQRVPGFQNQDSRCRYCQAKLLSKSKFCPKCKRAQV